MAIQIFTIELIDNPGDIGHGKWNVNSPYVKKTLRAYLIERGFNIDSISTRGNSGKAIATYSDGYGDVELLAAIEDYKAIGFDVVAYRDKKIDDIDVLVKKFVQERYPEHRQRTLTFLFSEAGISGLTNRMNYLKGAWDWVGYVIGYFYQLRDAINAVSTAAEIDGVVNSVDFSPFLPGEVPYGDPEVTIEQSMGILD